MTAPIGMGGGQDIILSPETYAYTQAKNNGSLRVHVGATAITMSGQEHPVRYDADKGGLVPCQPQDAPQSNAYAAEGDYLVLNNPANDNKHPEPNGARDAVKLNSGRRINIAGPCSIALWPGQFAKPIKGHQLRSNQYLIARIYNEEEARKNWAKTVFKTVAPKPNDSKPNNQNTGETTEPASVVTQNIANLDLSLGALHIIRGTDISFYIPPTGVEVLADEEGNYIREAVTLEQLEYCILVDESGRKRYERGPAVIFPNPTEQFITNESARKFRALELNEIQGIHVKVIAEYKDGETLHKVGDELFLTGDDTAIYYPRPEHSIIRYGDQEKHYATAIPAGEGRYVMNRVTGAIATITGPKMLLPDPRKEVVVRRVLSQKQVERWYPGNVEALQYNQHLEEATKEIGTQTANFVNDTALRNYKGSSRGEAAAAFAATGYEAGELSTTRFGLQVRESAGKAHVADSFSRGTAYTKPRTITLDTKYEGVPAINVWTGYAVMVVNKSGRRKVEEGPCNVLLDYDETLEVLELSTGKPKNTDKLERTVYLRVANNKVSDIIEVETSDHVKVNLKISMRVNFEGEPEKWFSVENYVKLLTDHVRSVLKGAVKKYKIEEFYNTYVDTIRSIILGEPEGDSGRPGMSFDENGMAINDVEVLECSISDNRIKTLLEQTQHDVVKTNIDLNTAQRQLEYTEKTEEINRRKATAVAETEAHKREIQVESVKHDLEIALARLESQIQQATERHKSEDAEQDIIDLSAERERARNKADADQDASIKDADVARHLQQVAAEDEGVIKRFKAMEGPLVEALTVLGRNDVAVKLAEATSLQRVVGAKSLVETVQKIMKDTPFAEIVRQISEGRSHAEGNGRLTGSDA